MTAVALLCAITLQFVGKPNIRPYPYQQATSTQSTQPSTSQNDQTSATHAEHTDKSMPPWYAIPEWWLVGVGILTLVGIWYQARETAHSAAKTADSVEAINKQAAIMDRQTAAAEKAAKAAEMSAQAAMGTAIPRLMLYAIGFADHGFASFEAVLQYPKIDIRVKNYGQTPAFLKSQNLDITCEELPDQAIYGKEVFFPPEAVVEPQDVSYLHVRPGQGFTEADIQAIIRGDKILSVYGRVYYGDVFGNPDRVFKFCKQLHIGRPTLDGVAFLESGKAGYTDTKNKNLN